MSFADKSQFEYLAQALVKEFPALQNTSTNSTFFQFTGEPIEADWGDGSSLAAYHDANTGPGSLDGFYTPTSIDVAQSYQDFIASIAPSNFGTNSQYQGFQAQLSALASEYATLSTKALADFKTWIAQNPSFAPDFAGFKGYTTWLTTDATGGPAWKAKLDDNKGQQAAVIKSIAEFMTSVDSTLARAQKASQDPANMATLVSDSGVTGSYPFTSIQDITGAMAAWTSMAAGNYELDTTINAETISATPWNQVVTTTVSRSCGKISTNTEIDYNRIVTDTKFNLRVCAIGARVFTVSRGNWFDASWLTSSNFSLPEGCRFKVADFFGPQGTLKMIPVSMLVIYKPRVEITISTQTFDETVSNYFSASASLSLFGLNFSLGASLNNIAIRDDGTQTVKIVLDSYSAPNTVPQLFGVSSQSFYRP